MLVFYTQHLINILIPSFNIRLFTSDSSIILKLFYLTLDDTVFKNSCQYEIGVFQDLEK